MNRNHTSHGRLELYPLVGSLLLFLACGSVDVAGLDAAAGAAGTSGGSGGNAADAARETTPTEDAPSAGAGGSSGSSGAAGAAAGAGGAAGGCAVVNGLQCVCGGDCGPCPTPEGSYTPCAAPNDWQARGCKVGGVPYVGCRRAPDGTTLYCAAACP